MSHKSPDKIHLSFFGKIFEFFAATFDILGDFVMKIVHKNLPIVNVSPIAFARFHADGQYHHKEKEHDRAEGYPIHSCRTHQYQTVGRVPKVLACCIGRIFRLRFLR